MRNVYVISILVLSLTLYSGCMIQGNERSMLHIETKPAAHLSYMVHAGDTVELHLQTLCSFNHAVWKMQQMPTQLVHKLSENEVRSNGVLVNKFNKLPNDYRPSDLVYPNAPFIFDERVDKRKLRKEAARALEQLIAGARQDGIYLAGVSAYRSQAAQTEIYQNNVRRYGKKMAELYCAEPGHSEHKTGLAVDLTRSDGKCAVEACFAVTKEAKWLKDHAHEYGYIVRYPKGKEHITGYQYEPWHIRYVGKNLSWLLTERDITLEEYYQSSYPYWNELGK